jgi:hypothetical protein
MGTPAGRSGRYSQHAHPQMSARAGNRRFGMLSALRAYTKKSATQIRFAVRIAEGADPPRRAGPDRGGGERRAGRRGRRLRAPAARHVVVRRLQPSHGRVCYSTLLLTVIDCHSLGICTLILLSLQSFSVEE